jgi:hypothetical protein
MICQGKLEEIDYKFGSTIVLNADPRSVHAFLVDRDDGRAKLCELYMQRRASTLGPYSDDMSAKYRRFAMMAYIKLSWLPPLLRLSAARWLMWVALSLPSRVGHMLVPG